MREQILVVEAHPDDVAAVMAANLRVEHLLAMMIAGSLVARAALVERGVLVPERGRN